MRSLFLVSVLACRTDEPEPKDDRTDPVDTDSDSDADGDTDTDTDADSDTDGPAPVVPLVDVTVDVHPQIATVLAVSWEQQVASDAVWLSWTVGGVAGSSPPEPVAIGPARQSVYGVPSETDVDTITVHALIDGVEVQIDAGSATTGSLPSDLTDAALRVATAGAFRPEPYLLTSVDVGPTPFYGPCYTVILDAEGRVVWYRATPGTRLTWQANVSRDGGSLLADESTTYTFDDPNPPTVSRFTLDLSQTETTELPGMMVAYGELDDGTFVYDEGESSYAFHLTHRLANGTTERIWSCEPWMAPYTTQFWGCATNTTLWDPARGTVTWSTFETDIVVEIDLATGEIAAEYGPYPGGFTFDPPESALVKQHFPNWTPSGNLIASTHTATGRRQVAREFEVDTATSTLREIWHVETPDYAEYGGQIQALPSGNRLWQLGTTGVIQEITPDGEPVWRVEWPGHLVGNTTPLADLYPLDAGW